MQPVQGYMVKECLRTIPDLGVDLWSQIVFAQPGIQSQIVAILFKAHPEDWIGPQTDQSFEAVIYEAGTPHEVYIFPALFSDCLISKGHSKYVSPKLDHRISVTRRRH